MCQIDQRVHWIGTEVSNLPTFDGLNHLETFLAEFEKIVPVQQRMLALDEALKATPARWWCYPPKLHYGEFPLSRQRLNIIVQNSEVQKFSRSKRPPGYSTFP
jgi:hypothetical protein